MTNNLMLKGAQINITLNITVRQAPKAAKSATTRPIGSEVLVLSLSNNLYRIKTFNSSVPVFDLHGYGLMFFKSAEGYVAYLEQFEEQNLFDLQTVPSLNYKADARRFCHYDYMDSDTEVKVEMNFETEAFHIRLNGKDCINYKVNTRLFTEPKVAVTFGGFSKGANPISVRLNEVSLYKSKNPSAQEFQKTFHNDVDTFINALDWHDPLHSLNASFSNILLTQVT